MPSLDNHYRDIRERCDCDPVNFDIGDLPASYLHQKFAAVDGREAVASATPGSTIFTTGIGMTGPPHLGTLGQILTAIEFQQAGFDVQLVLADLEPYHSGADLESMMSLANRYREFISDIGFDPGGGCLRTQEESVDVMHSAQLLAPYFNPEKGNYFGNRNPTDWERAVEDAYKQADSPTDMSGPTSEAAQTHSLLLHLTDFLHPLMEWDYDQIVITLGIDEQGLTVGTRNFLNETEVDGTVAGLHTKMLPGIGEYPKMSKSIPESVIDMTMDPASIRRLIADFEDDFDQPDESSVFQMMLLASTYSPEKLERMYDRCTEGGETWESARAEYADHLAEFAEKW